MDFAITFDANFTHPDYALGSITIGPFTDYFRASTHFWTVKDYEIQWHEAINLVVSEGTPTALITDLSDPQSANFIMWWPLWRNGDYVVIQNQILILGELATPYSLNRLYEHVGDYSGNKSDDGEKISEWQIPILDMTRFQEEPKVKFSCPG